jgi:mRNA interferase HicA
MKYRDVSEKLKSLGCEVVPRRGKGSHRVWHNPANGRIVTLPHWGAKDLKIGTIRGAVKQLGLEWKEFVAA